MSLYVYLPDCDKVVEKAVAGGAKILKPVEDQFYGDRSGFIQDPFGHLWGIATHVEDVSADRDERTSEESDAGRLTGQLLLLALSRAESKSLG